VYTRSHNDEIASGRISQNVSPSLSDAYLYLDYQSCDWNSRLPAETFVYVSRTASTAVYCALPKYLEVLEKSKINSLIVSFLHPVFTFPVTGRYVLLITVFFISFASYTVSATQY
jgi:hypothetical protein